jgi:hypothetical protein
LGCGVVGYNLTARDAEQLSEAVDRYLSSRPWLTRTVVAVLALHLLNSIPIWADPLALAFSAARVLR